MLPVWKFAEDFLREHDRWSETGVSSLPRSLRLCPDAERTIQPRLVLSGSRRTAKFRTSRSSYEFFFGQRTTGLFIEVGAFDGYNYSNTYGLAQRGWTGFLIEPDPVHYEECRKRYREFPKITVSNCAISDGSADKLSLTRGGLITTSSSAQAEAYRQTKYFRDMITEETFLADCYTFDTYLRNHAVPAEADVVVVDVEGATADVFSGFTLSTWRPKMLIVELFDLHPTPGRDARERSQSSPAHFAKRLRDDPPGLDQFHFRPHRYSRREDALTALGSIPVRVTTQAIAEESTMNERAFLAQLESANTDELAQILRRPNADEERLLEVYFGAERLQRLRGLALTTQRRGLRGAARQRRCPARHHGRRADGLSEPAKQSVHLDEHSAPRHRRGRLVAHDGRLQIAIRHSRHRHHQKILRRTNSWPNE